MLFRNRLENNSDHWNALFLCLRELAEWTVKKESELESMGPLGGDEASIRQQQVDKIIYLINDFKGCNFQALSSLKIYSAFYHDPLYDSHRTLRGPSIVSLRINEP